MRLDIEKVKRLLLLLWVAAFDHDINSVYYTKQCNRQNDNMEQQ